MVVLSSGGRLGSPESFCFYCGRQVRAWKNVPRVEPPPDTRTADHVLPQCRGGKYGKLVTACLACNRDKNHLTLDEFRVVVAFRAGKVPLPAYKFAAEERLDNRPQIL